MVMMTSSSRRCFWRLRLEAPPRSARKRPLWCSPGFRTGQAANFSRYSFGVRYPSAECGRSAS
jgi:hypothetical protein